jgi:type III pantothenate kinase
MQSSLALHTAKLPTTSEAERVDGFGLSTDAAIYKGCLAAQVGAIHEALHVAKEMHQPIDRIWIDGGNAKNITAELKLHSLSHAISIEAINGLVLRGIGSWMRQELR